MAHISFSQRLFHAPHSVQAKIPLVALHRWAGELAVAQAGSESFTTKNVVVHLADNGTLQSFTPTQALRSNGSVAGGGHVDLPDLNSVTGSPGLFRSFLTNDQISIVSNVRL